LWRSDAAAYLAYQPTGETLKQCAVVAATESSVEINQLHQRKRSKADDPIFEIIELEHLLLSLHELNDFSVHEVDRRDQHGHLTGIPATARLCFKSPRAVVP